MNFIGINHVALVTSDMDTTIRFWRDLLGMRLIAGIGAEGNRQYFFEIAENSMISFFEWPDVKPIDDKDPGRPVAGPFGFDHICFEVENRDELWSLRDKLEAADIWFTEVLDNGFIHSIFSTDPNNIQLEFCYRVQGINISQQPRMLDTDQSAITAEGPELQTGRWPEVTRATPEQERKVHPGPLKKLAG
jgi:catechol 2,3-dioxygenase-like lactoylglutathione lyase family enzyme